MKVLQTQTTIAIEHLWIRLRNFSIRSCLAIVVLLFLVTSCQRRSSGIRPTFNDYGQSATSTTGHEVQAKASKAPWEVWSTAKYGNKDFQLALRLEEEGNLESASEHFSKALSSAKTSEEAETYLLLQSSIDLKSGSPDKALARISKYASKRKINASQLDSRFSLLTSYCYIAESNPDQAYAWLVQSFKAGHEVGKISEEARRVSREYLRTFSSIELNGLQSRWEKDSFVSSLIREEKNRRLQGGSAYSKTYMDKYFKSSSYELRPNLNVGPQGSEVGAMDLPGIDDPVLENVSEIKIGALLPVSGQYATHAKKVEDGIRLALRENGLESTLIVYDSNNDLIQSYNRLANEDKVRIVFGPMLVKDVEKLASLQGNLTVPLLTYAKKRGLPALSPQIFRLGGTPENQLQSLVVFAQSKLGARKIALLYPEGEIGVEYNDAIQAMNGRGSDVVIQSFQYQSRNLNQIDLLKAELINNNFDSVIVSDSLPSAEPLLRALKDPTNPNNLNVLGVSLLVDPVKILSYQTLMEGTYLVSLFNTASSQADTALFINNYKREFGGEADLLAAQSYDSVKFALSAIQNTSNPVEESLLKSSQLSGVTGTMHMLSDGDIHRDLAILKVVNGGLFEVSQ